MNELARETRELLSSALHHPDGVAPLWEAHLESAAALYQVRPSRLEALRRELPVMLSPEQSRALAADAPPPPATTSAEQRPENALDLIALAARQPAGLELLRHAPLETAAILFGAHVFDVETARTLLEQGVVARA
ncbi:MAG: hypothetical protein ACOZQL_41995 [Myxococcota bacterium]